MVAFDPPLMILIDEAAHAAPLRDLPNLLQVAQTRVVLPGSPDPATLELARSLIGERHPIRWSEQRRPPLDPRRLDAKMLVSHAHEAALLLRPAPWYRCRAMRRLAQPAPVTGSPGISCANLPSVGVQRPASFEDRQLVTSV